MIGVFGDSVMNKDNNYILKWVFLAIVFTIVMVAMFHFATTNIDNPSHKNTTAAGNIVDTNPEPAETVEVKKTDGVSKGTNTVLHFDNLQINASVK